MVKISFKADHIGAAAGLLCMVHCMATPFLFLVKTCAHTCCLDAPMWWQLIDYLFLVISGFAIYYATKHSIRQWVRFMLWGAWIALLLALLDERWGFIALPAGFGYIPSLIIVGLHLYNRRHCKACDNTTSLNASVEKR